MDPPSWSSSCVSPPNISSSKLGSYTGSRSFEGSSSVSSIETPSSSCVSPPNISASASSIGSSTEMPPPSWLSPPSSSSNGSLSAIPSAGRGSSKSSASVAGSSITVSSPSPPGSKSSSKLGLYPPSVPSWLSAPSVSRPPNSPPSPYSSSGPPGSMTDPPGCPSVLDVSYTTVSSEAVPSGISLQSSPEKSSSMSAM